MYKKILFIKIICSLLLSATATAGEDSSAKTIFRTVDDFVRMETRHLPGEVIININQQDSRQTIRPCNQLQPFLPPGGRLWGKFSVGVRCQDEASWTLYVPVEIEVITRVIHTAQPVSMGKQLEAQDIVSKEVDLVRISGEAVTDPDQAIGKVATTFLASGQPIRTHQLRAPHIISRGQKVRLTAIGTGFSVSTEGKALSAAAEGEVVQVRNPTGRIISGIARAGGIVEVRH